MESKTVWWGTNKRQPMRIKYHKKITLTRAMQTAGEGNFLAAYWRASKREVL